MTAKDHFFIQIFKRKISKEEWLNVITHGIGVVLSLVAIPYIIQLAFSVLSGLQIAGVVAFCVGLLFMYSSSTAYHYAITKKSKQLLKTLDHISIFVLIGGSYTAFVLTYLNNSTGWTFLIVMYAIIAFGIVMKLFFTGRFEWVSLILYLVLGWMIVFIYEDVVADMPEVVLNWLIIGGLSYTIGTIFYAVKYIPYGHVYWHLFVIGGATTHYISLYSGLQTIQLSI